MKSTRIQRVAALLLAAGLALWLAGCVTPPIPGASPDLLTFLQIGKSTREEVLLRLGQPSASFEHERILTYRIGEDPEQGRYVVTPQAQVVPAWRAETVWGWVRYSLVLVFDDLGRLQTKKLVTVGR